MDFNNIINTIINGDALDVLKKMPNESIDMVITSPPYWNLRDYGVNGQIGNEETFVEYLNNLMSIFNEVRRVLSPNGSCWVNIGDTYIKKKQGNVNKKSLACLPDRFKIGMVENGWICRNEIIWHKPNAMPSSAKNRFNNDYEKLFFFTKGEKYYFETQYEPLMSNNKQILIDKNKERHSKYLDESQESSVRQGMNKSRGSKLVFLRKNLPTQQEFVDFLRERTTLNILVKNTDIKKTKIEHWFRRDENGFSFPSQEDWNAIKWLLDNNSQTYHTIDEKMNDVTIETDDILKNVHKGRIKRAVWSISTKAFKGNHFAPYPKELIEIPIKSCCQENGIVLDMFFGSGTTGVVCLENKRNYIGIELNNEYINIAEKRIKESLN